MERQTPLGYYTTPMELLSRFEHMETTENHKRILIIIMVEQGMNFRTSIHGKMEKDNRGFLFLLRKLIVISLKMILYQGL